MTKEILKSKIFWLAAVIIFAVTFLSLVSRSFSWQAETEIIFLPQNPTVAANMNQVLQNARELAWTEAFANQIENSAKVQNWPINAEILDGSGIIRVSVEDYDALEAQNINRQASRAILDQMSRYYNIRTDLDMRIIDGPNVRQIFSANVFILFLESLLLGVLAGVLVWAVYNILPAPEKIALPSFSRFSLAEIAKKFPNMSRPAAKTDQEILTEQEGEPDMAKAKSTIMPSKKSAAPGNLPVASDEAYQAVQEKLYANGKNGKLEENIFPLPEAEKTVSEKDIFREATQEEVKKRLNELLSGKF